ncbi:MAG: helix-turn-helix domain-containing protein [Moorea sp. SIO4E2]|uniref:helix-turn-helix domain-containing protein n=1 Tax=Moorena sp. SIO4E2 TaxID=2607826 RepID=UPI0013B735F0|nr:helix-turn-helix domain-containing protein [Moorena sp. SIO4E2]NEQ04874.1 helix-turn-helix domain-containing protein [Moorena sp. SIO4E2]
MSNQENRKLDKWINSNPDSRELKRALAVKFAIQGWKYQAISESLNVSKSFISKWKKKFNSAGVEGLKLSYKGGKGYLNKQEKKEVITWIKKRYRCNFEQLEGYLLEEYNVVFKSPTSYYKLLSEARMSWEESKKNNPYKDPDLLDKILNRIYNQA